jgi:hypothetical protein
MSNTQLHTYKVRLSRGRALHTVVERATSAQAAKDAAASKYPEWTVVRSWRSEYAR